MNPVDIAAIAILVISALFGLARGFVREVLGLAAWVGAAIGAFALFPLLDPPFRHFAVELGLEPLAGDAIAAAFGFLVLLVAFSAVANLVARFVQATPFGGLDRILGLAFGAVRGAALLVVAYVLGGLVAPPADWPGALRRAAAVPLAFAGAHWAVTIVPEPDRPHVAPPPNSGPPNGQRV